jgi:hypothetical protein
MFFGLADCAHIFRSTMKYSSLLLVPLLLEQATANFMCWGSEAKLGCFFGIFGATMVAKNANGGPCQEICAFLPFLYMGTYTCGTCDKDPGVTSITVRPAPTSPPAPTTLSPTTFTHAPTPVPSKAFDITLDFDSSVPTQHHDKFITAKKKWESVIVGDLPPYDFTGKAKPTQAFAGCSYPDNNIVDDVRICIGYADIAANGVVGYGGVASPFRNNNGKLLPVLSSMTIKSGVVDQNPVYLQTVLTHEMGHALVRSPLIDRNSDTELLNGGACFDYDGAYLLLNLFALHRYRTGTWHRKQPFVSHLLS